MTYRGLAPRRFSRAEAAASRLRSEPRAVLTIGVEPLAGGSLRLSTDPGGLQESTSNERCISLVWGADCLELRCPRTLVRQVLSALDPALEEEVMPPDLAALLLEFAMLPIIKALEQATRRKLSITGLTTANPGVTPTGLGFVLESDDQLWPLSLSSVPVHSDASDPLAALMQFWPPAPKSMARFRMPAALRIGTTRLSIAALRSLRPGDAVLLQVGDGSSGMLVVAERWTAPARRHAAAWHLLEAPKAASESGRMEWTMRSLDAVEDSPETPPINDPDQLPVQLTFEVGRLELTLAELRRLGPGSIIELGRGFAEPVRISAHGRPVGQGELVDVEGMVAVKVVRLFDYE
jgi:type III secretion protein Q